VELAEGVEGVVGEVFVVALAGGFTGVQAHPVDLAARGLGGRTQDFLGCRCDVGADAVAVDDRDDRVVRNVKAAVYRLDALPVCGDFDVLIRHIRASIGRVKGLPFSRERDVVTVMQAGSERRVCISSSTAARAANPTNPTNA